MELDTQQAFVAVASLATSGDSLLFTFCKTGGLSDGSGAAKGA